MSTETYNLTDDDAYLDFDSEYAASGDESSLILEYDALSAQAQWEESMNQIQMVLGLVLFPLIGKLLGRRFSKIIWRRFADWWWV